MSSRLHRGKKMEMNEDDEVEAPKSLEEKLSNCIEPIRQPFIYRVGNYYLRDVNDKVHEPRIVAIGPYHHGKQSLKMMEQHKLRYLKSLLLRNNESVGTYLSAVAEIEGEARSCYAEDLSYLSSDELTQMLVLDGCFIIELLLRRSLDPDPSDTIFQMKFFLYLLKDDLILFENQIPFFVLCKLFDLIRDKWDLINSFFSFLDLKEDLDRSKGLMNVKVGEVRHLLHLYHAALRPSSPRFVNLTPCHNQRKSLMIPSATGLKDANVTFRERQVGSSSVQFEVEFSNGVLTVSNLSIDDRTDSFFRNLIVYEQYFPDGRPTYVTDYMAMVLDCLVNTGRDVEILSECGIIVNATGHDQVAADIINRLAQFVLVSHTHFIYAHTFEQINAHHKRKWNRARAALNRDYFNTPWAYISFFGGVLLILLTLAQTIFSAIQL